MQRLSPDRAQDPPSWTLFPIKVSLSLSLSLSRIAMDMILNLYLQFETKPAAHMSFLCASGKADICNADICKADIYQADI